MYYAVVYPEFDHHNKEIADAEIVIVKFLVVLCIF